MANDITPSIEWIVVTIDETDLATRSSWAYDKTQVRLQVSWRESPAGVLRVPKQGELWLAIRRGFTWYLESKLDSDEEHASVVANFEPGDVRISGDRVFFDSAIYEREILNFPAEFTEATLSKTPIEGSVTAYINGLVIQDDLYTVTDKTLTFVNSMAIGNLYVIYQVSGA